MRGIEQYLQVDAATLGALKYAGTWNASTNTPTLASGVGVQGQYYVVSVAGSTNLDGETAWQVGDWAVFNGTVWQKVDGGSTGLLSTLTVTGNTFLATTSGDVGIGATSVTAIYGKTLQIGSGTSEATTSLVGSTGSVFLATVGATGQLIARGGMALVLGSNDIERLRITSAGDVGIGTSSPGYKLDVYKAGAASISAARSDTQAVLRSEVGACVADLNVVSTYGEVRTATNHPLLFSTNATERMRITSAGDVGIGTSSPATKLEVYGGDVRSTLPGASATTFRGLSIASDSTEFSSLKAEASTGETRLTSGFVGFGGYSTFHTNGSERLRIDTSGNLGLGAAPSAWGLGKAIEVGVAGNSVWGVQNADLRLTANMYYDGANYRYVNNGISARYDVGNASLGGHAWYTAPSGTAGNTISFTQAMTLDTSGNLGLGVTPQAWGSNYKAIELAGASAGVVSAYVNNLNLGTNIRNDNTNWIYTYTGQNATRYTMHSNGQHQWYNAPSGTAGNTISFTQAMTLDASGNLGIGTSSPTYKADIQVGSGADQNILLAGVSGTSNGFHVKWVNSTAKTHVIIADIPTSSAGLATGTLWNDGGTIKIA